MIKKTAEERIKALLAAKVKLLGELSSESENTKRMIGETQSTIDALNFALAMIDEEKEGVKHE